MKNAALSIFFIIGMLLFSGAAIAGSPQIGKDDTVQTVLAAQKGKQVTIRLGNGDELTGKVGEVTGKLVVLQTLSGKEFFDAVINTDRIAAVLVRNKD